VRYVADFQILAINTFKIAEMTCKGHSRSQVVALFDSTRHFLLVAYFDYKLIA